MHAYNMHSMSYMCSHIPLIILVIVSPTIIMQLTITVDAERDKRGSKEMEVLGKLQKGERMHKKRY